MTATTVIKKLSEIAGTFQNHPNMPVYHWELSGKVWSKEEKTRVYVKMSSKDYDRAWDLGYIELTEPTSEGYAGRKFVRKTSNRGINIDAEKEAFEAVEVLLKEKSV